MLRYIDIIGKFVPCMFRELIKKYILDFPLFHSIYKEYVKKEISRLGGNFIPNIVYIEITNSCNAKCVMCVRKEMTRPIGFMGMELYKKIVNECAAWNIHEIRLHNIGEPLLDKTLVEKIAYAKKKGIPKVVFYTNGSLLNPELCKEIILAGIDEIFVSFDAATKHTYETIRKGLKFEHVSDGIKSLLDARNNMKLGSPKIHIAYTCMDLNRKEIRPFKLKWESLVDSVYFCDICDWATQKEMDSKIYRFNRKWPCVYLWKAMFIHWNGDVVICCLDFNRKVVFGNAGNETLEKIWTNNKYQHVRKLHLDNTLTTIPICDKCTSNRLWSQYD